MAMIRRRLRSAWLAVGGIPGGGVDNLLVNDGGDHRLVNDSGDVLLINDG